MLLGFTFGAALLGWRLMTVEWLPVVTPLDCKAIFSSQPKLEAISGASERAVQLTITLTENHPDVFLVYQLVDKNGFGWLVERADPESARQRSTELSTGHPLKTIRLGVMTLSEHERARAIDRAAQHFEVRDWLRLRGWQAPHLTICEAFDV